MSTTVQKTGRNFSALVRTRNQTSISFDSQPNRTNVLFEERPLCVNSMENRLHVAPNPNRLVKNNVPYQFHSAIQSHLGDVGYQVSAHGSKILVQ